MEVGVERGNSVVQWYKLTAQKRSLEIKWKQAWDDALAEGRNPARDDKVAKYSFHLKGVNKAMQRFLGSPF